MSDYKLLQMLACSFAFLGFGASLVVHLTTFLDVDPSQKMPSLWFLHLGIFLVWLPMMFSLRAKGLSKTSFLGRSSWLPRWGQGLLFLFFLYALFNFASVQLHTPPKTPHLVNGRYMVYQDRVQREITQQEYNRFQALTVRGFSGHWMLFYLAAGLNLFYLPRITPTERSR